MHLQICKLTDFNICLFRLSQYKNKLNTIAVSIWVIICFVILDTVNPCDLYTPSTGFKVQAIHVIHLCSVLLCY